MGGFREAGEDFCRNGEKGDCVLRGDLEGVGGGFLLKKGEEDLCCERKKDFWWGSKDLFWEG